MSTDEIIIPTDPDVELSDDEFRKIVRADLDGNEAATAYLAQDVEDWLRGLQELAQDIETQFSKRKADSQVFQNNCLADPMDGRTAWFAYKAEYDQWRSSASHVKRITVARLREVREMIKENNRQSNPANTSWQAALNEILVRLTRIEEHLGVGK